MVIDPERDCNRKRQGVLSVIGLTIAAMMLGSQDRVQTQATVDGPNQVLLRVRVVLDAIEDGRPPFRCEYLFNVEHCATDNLG